MLRGRPAFGERDAGHEKEVQNDVPGTILMLWYAATAQEGSPTHQDTYHNNSSD